jgi:hypothetical protein
MCAEPTSACLNNTCCRLEHPLLSNISNNNNSNNNKDRYNEDDDCNNSVKSNRQDWDIVILNRQNSTAVNEKDSHSNSSPRAVAVMVVAQQIFIEDYLSSTSVC